MSHVENGENTVRSRNDATACSRSTARSRSCGVSTAADPNWASANLPGRRGCRPPQSTGCSAPCRRTTLFDRPARSDTDWGHSCCNWRIPVPFRAPLREAALPFMTDLRDEFDETVGLHELHRHGHRIVAAQVESHQELRRTYNDIGVPIRLAHGGPGKAIWRAACRGVPALPRRADREEDGGDHRRTGRSGARSSRMARVYGVRRIEGPAHSRDLRPRRAGLRPHPEGDRRDRGLGPRRCG